MKLGTMLADCALRYPDREAMVCGDAAGYGFAELDRTRDPARQRTIGGRSSLQGDRIALYLPNSAELVEVDGGDGAFWRHHRSNLDSADHR